jgi:hypothetical protein
MRLCSVEGCGRKHDAMGWCKKHYFENKPGRCLVEGCNRRPHCRALCRNHYLQALRKGRGKTAHIRSVKLWQGSGRPAAIRYNFGTRLRLNLNDALHERNTKRAKEATRYLDCSIEELKIWLRIQFQPGMCWENYGQWHIDHVLPLKAFDLTNEGQRLQALNWMNLQPLWKHANWEKARVE